MPMTPSWCFSFTVNPTLDRSNFQRGLLGVAEWMNANCLHLNANKTEVFFLGKDTLTWDNPWLPSLGSPPYPSPPLKK